MMYELKQGSRVLPADVKSQADAIAPARERFVCAALQHPLRLINSISGAAALNKARWLAIGHPMHLGDVVATLPLAGILKKNRPELKICFIGKEYVRPLLDCCEHIDRFLDVEAVLSEPALLGNLGVDIFINPFPDRKLAKAAHRAGIPLRVGNLRRPNIWRYCNRFVAYSRRDYSRHEIELNLENLAGIGLPTSYPLPEIESSFGLTRTANLDEPIAGLLDPGRLNIIFHPKSNRNGREWPPFHYAALARLLPSERFNILVTGLAHEGEKLRNEVPEMFLLPNLSDLTGKLSLPQLLALIHLADGLVASGTGPLHIAAAMGRHVLGIFPPRVSIDPAHWAPIGPKGDYLCLEERCLPINDRCPDDFPGGFCACTAAITPEQVMARLLTWSKNTPI